MITDIPEEADFRNVGLSYLNLAWKLSVDLGLSLLEADSDGLQDQGNVERKYWEAAQHSLGTALSLTQQGTEFLVKSRIASVSPFLLLDGSPRDWPKKCNMKNTPFSAFKTIDAQHLIRVHDTVTNRRLDNDFGDRFTKLRGSRNSLMHTVDRSVKFTCDQVIEAVLYA